MGEEDPRGVNAEDTTMTLTAERVRNLALNVGTSALAVRELVREHLWKEEWVATPTTLEAVAWVRARLREKPNDLRLAGPWQARPALR